MSGNAQILITWKYSIESHIVPRLWIFEEIWEYLLPVYGKQMGIPIFSTQGSGYFFPVNPYNSQNMRKVDSSSMQKTWENTNIRKLKVSLIFRVKQKSTQYPKHEMSEFP